MVNNRPVITIILCLFTCIVYFFPEWSQESMYFDRAQLEQGNFKGLLFGHWLHVGKDHLLWNVSALALLGGMLEMESRRMLLVSLLMGMLAVDLLLLSPLCVVDRYCGLSGVLNAVFFCLLYALWHRTRSSIVTVMALLAVFKVILEILMGQAVFTDTLWPPYAPAHLAGMLGAVLICTIQYTKGLSDQGRVRVAL